MKIFHLEPGQFEMDNVYFNSNLFLNLHAFFSYRIFATCTHCKSKIVCRKIISFSKMILLTSSAYSFVNETMQTAFVAIRICYITKCCWVPFWTNYKANKIYLTYSIVSIFQCPLVMHVNFDISEIV